MRPRRVRPPPRRTAAALPAKPARPRLVHLLSRRRPDRLWSVRRGLSDDAEMDPGRDRAGAVDRRHRRTDRPDAGRRHHRCRAQGTAGRGLCGRRHRRARARLCGVADLSGDRGGGDAACRWPAACWALRSPRSASGWSARRDRRTVRAQCAVRLARQRLCRGADGRLRLFPVEPLGVSRHLRACHLHHHRAVADPRPRNRSRRGPWRDHPREAGSGGHQRRHLLRPAPAADLCRQRAAAAARQRRDAAA